MLPVNVLSPSSISKIDTPLAGTVLLFSSQHDFLALSVEFSTAEVITAVLNLDDSLTEKVLAEQVEEQAMAADRAALQAVYQLFPAMHQTIPSKGHLSRCPFCFGKSKKHPRI